MLRGGNVLAGVVLIAAAVARGAETNAAATTPRSVVVTNDAVLFGTNAVPPPMIDLVTPGKVGNRKNEGYQRSRRTALTGIEATLVVEQQRMVTAARDLTDVENRARESSARLRDLYKQMGDARSAYYNALNEDAGYRSAVEKQNQGLAHYQDLVRQRDALKKELGQ